MICMICMYKGEDPPLMAALYASRSLAHARLREWDAARRDAERSLGLQPDNLNLACHLGVALLQLGDLDQARGRLGWVLLRDPGHKGAREALAAMEARRRSLQVKGLLAPDVPREVGAELARLREGYALLHVATSWADLDAAWSTGLESSGNRDELAACLAHALRWQPPLGRFFRQALAAAAAEAAMAQPACEAARTPLLPSTALVFGAGACAAAAAAASLVATGTLRKVAVAEPSACLASLCQEVVGPARVFRASAQLDSEFAAPDELFRTPVRLRLLMPSGDIEEIAADDTDSGLAVAASARRCAALHGLPPDVQVDINIYN